MLQVRYLTASKGRPAKQTSPTDDGAKKAIQFSIDLIARTWSRPIDQLSSQWRDLHDTFIAGQNKMIDIATETYDLSNRGRKGMRETQQHFLAIELWYRRWWAQQATQINQCRIAIVIGFLVADFLSDAA